MPKTYVTFGAGHSHIIDDKQLGPNVVAVIECKDKVDGRDKAFEFFGPKFCFEYHEKELEMCDMSFFPGGFIYIN